MTDKLCGCMKCHAARALQTHPKVLSLSFDVPGFRYSCEICGNKRCPHHSDHALACTNSNEPDQPGSLLKSLRSLFS